MHRSGFTLATVPTKRLWISRWTGVAGRQTMRRMTGMATYVGAEPEGLRSLASALDVAKGELRYANDRIQALLAEAGDGDVTCGALSVMAGELTFASADIRTRATIAQDLIRVANTPACVVRWYHPLLRAPAAIKNNTWNAGAGAVNAVTETGTTLWRLTPVNDEWRQEWVDLKAGLQAAKENPVETLEAVTGMPQLDERGYSYWLGGVAPDVIAAFAGGLGLAKRFTSTIDVVTDAADAAEDAADVAEDVVGAAPVSGAPALSRVLMGRTNSAIMEGEHGGPLGWRPRRDPHVEPLARARVLAVDKDTGGHSAARHGPETTLQQQQVRAETGLTPEGKQREPWDASRFFRWQDLDAAIEDARSRWTAGDAAVPVSFDHVVGEGYLVGGKEYVQTRVVLVKFNKSGQPYTAFPNLRVAP